MKTKQIVFGLMLVPLIGFMGSKSVFASPEPATILFLFGIVILIFLLLLFVYQTKSDMAKMQKTMDGLAAELKRTREAKKERCTSRQRNVKKEVKLTSWDDLGQVEKDEHIAKIIKSMEYTGSTSSAKQQMSNTQDIIPISS